MARRKKKKTKGFAAQTVAEAEEQGRLLQTTPCPVEEHCGGCSFQTLGYAEELEAKRRFIASCFAAQGFEDLIIPRPLAAPQIYGYRNNMEFSFSAKRWLTPEEIASGEEFERSFALGLHVPGGFGRVLDLDRCDLANRPMNQIFSAVRDFARLSGKPAYDHHQHQGYWRFLIIRRSEASGETMLHLVTRELCEETEGRLLHHLQDLDILPNTVTWGVTDSVADTSVGAEIRTIHGSGFITETLRGLKFQIGPRSFFQPNSRTAATLFDLIAELSGDVEGLRVLDLFCGAGTLGLSMAARGATVTGVEIVAEAVTHARLNACLNGLQDRAEFIEADLLKGLPEGIPSCELLITDPPRAGMHPKALKRILEIAPPRIVSVGCNPKTQAADLRKLVDEGGYRISAMRGLDQFPRTPHVENLALLVRSEG